MVLRIRNKTPIKKLIRRPLLALLALACLPAISLLQPFSLLRSTSAVSNGIVISQVYGGGGNTGATYQNDFIELFNKGTSPVNVSGWSVQYTSATGAAWSVTNLTNTTIQPGQYYLVQEAAGAGGTTALPTPDATGSIALGATAGKVALVNSTTALAGTCPLGPAILDFAGFGSTANCFEGAAPTSAPSNTTAILRAANGCADTDVNSADFIAGSPAPRNSATALAPCGSPLLSINDVSRAEGNSGTTTFSFLVSLSVPAAAGGVSFNIATADGTTNPANSGSDYVARSLTAQTIPQGGSTYQFDVTVNGDTADEPNETFLVNVTNVSGAGVSDGQGLGTITNDDGPAIAIHTIQGSGSTSPLAGNLVTTTGIVTGVKSNGFFLQTPTAGYDADPNTSEGVFVFTSSSPPAAASVGNAVNVTGTVQEFIPSTDPQSPPVTEISGTPTVVLLSTGNPLPAAITLTANDTTQPSGTTNPLDTLEEFEGMRVAVPSMTVVAPTQGTINESSATVSSNGVFYGVVTGVPRPFREAGINISDPLPAGAPQTIPRFDENPEHLRVDSNGLNGQPIMDVPAGVLVTNLSGPLDFAFRSYTIDPETPSPVFSQGSPPALPTPLTTEFTIASFNMERFFDTTDDPGTSDPILTTAAFNRRVAKASLIIRTAQRYPDVIGVQEMENLSTLQTVANQINNDAITVDSLPNPNYVPYLVEGNDVGGIDVGFLVKASRVNVVDVTQFGLNTTYINPNNNQPELLNDRPPLVLRATIARPAAAGGGNFAFTVIVNHLRSLTSIDDPVDGNRVRTKRRAQAEYLANLIQARQTADPTESIVVLGDMNALRVNDGYVDVIGTILGTPAVASAVTLASSDLVNPDLFDLVDSLPIAQQYSYSFDGNAQTLDHIMLGRQALTYLSRFAYARDDADQAVKNYELTNGLRLSDHDQPVAYFNLAVPNGNVSGHISEGNGNPVEGVAVRLTGASNRLAVTDFQGNYQINNVDPASPVTVTPARPNFSFSPAQRNFSVVGQHTDAAFTATLGSSLVNPLDTTEYFVRQQYLDFLNREPDEAGLNFWVNNIESCGADQNCRTAKRTDTSAAFFLSVEFQQTGYLVYRTYQAAFGDLPALPVPIRLTEFRPDTAEIGSGVIVNRNGWEAVLENNKQAFMAEFVQRTRFTTAYPNTGTPAQFVDQLFANASVTPSASDRAAAIAEFGTETTTVDPAARARALRRVAENATLAQQEFNQAFVLMQYFGYLRRDPDSPPNTDFSGYNFWLNKLNAFNGNFNDADMVKAFLVSGEYRGRFVR